MSARTAASDTHTPSRRSRVLIVRGPRPLLLGGLEVGTGPAGVVGDVEHPRDLGDELLDGNLDPLAKRDGCHAATLASSAQSEVGRVVLYRHQLGVAPLG